MPPQILDFCSVSPLARRYASTKKLFFDEEITTDEIEVETIFSKNIEIVSTDVIDVSHNRKRRRTAEYTPKSSQSADVNITEDYSSMSDVIRAVERLSTNSDLVADGSRDNALPIVAGKHKDLKAITPQTMSAVLNGIYNHHIDHVTVIDARYPYEFEGGHIRGAINLYTKDAVQNFLNETVTSSENNHVIIFHCEFSSERGPKMYRHLRSLDRDLNKDSYPRLNFPEVYLLEGGYKAFYQQNQNQCFPQRYVPMLHQEHKNDLRHFRVKSKSWAAGDKPRHRSRLGQTGGTVRLAF
ncbi:M-phase inducer phosphatase 1-like [Mya arenaria]|uniref:M-phase inducer phosphatase 1-like n=1 Tax=Mya arenaria TaxID=6604 RepID=UPI0022DF2E73|nr:M-phase inducer phosphatase 1-like [Mya arenaria]